jgi:hypothetical protein
LFPRRSSDGLKRTAYGIPAAIRVVAEVALGGIQIRFVMGNHGALWEN